MSESAKRAAEAAVKKQERTNLIRRARAMKNVGYSNVLIAEQLGLAESTVRELLKSAE